MRTICASYRVIYGAAILHALQVVCKVKLPVLYVEAAELDTARLGAFLDALAAVRKEGNVIVAHWMHPQRVAEGVAVIQC
jgi:hypothetical protein